MVDGGESSNSTVRLHSWDGFSLLGSGRTREDGERKCRLSERWLRRALESREGDVGSSSSPSLNGLPGQSDVVSCRLRSPHRQELSPLPVLRSHPSPPSCSVLGTSFPSPQLSVPWSFCSSADTTLFLRSSSSWQLLRAKAPS